MASETLTEYERKRLENIKRNAEMMDSLKLRPKALAVSSSGTTKRNSIKRNHPKFVARCSLRAQGLQPEYSSLSFGTIKRERTKTKSYSNNKSLVPSGMPSNPSEIRKLDPLTMQEAYRGELSDRLLIDTIADMSNGNASWNCLGKELIGKGDCLDLGSMVLKPGNVARVMPGRVMEVKFFPCNDRTMVVAGNKSGNVVFWDVDCDEERNDGIYLYQPHTAAISGILIQRFSLSKVFSSGYEGVVRLLDFEKESFNLVYSSDNAIFSLSQQPQDANSLYLGEGLGLLNLWDTRVGKSSSSWVLHDDKINTIDFNPKNSNIMATSSSDGVVIWDLRQMDTDRAKNLKIVNHNRVVLSAYFSPSGSCLATTSFGNHVGIVSGLDFEDTSVVYHNNQAGRLIASFRYINNGILKRDTMASPPLTEYERGRLENIKRNDEMMASLKLQSRAFELSSFATKPNSFDNHVGIVSGVDFEDTSVVYHNNIPSFRAIWGWDDSYLFAGSMKKEVDVISREGNVTSLQSSNMSRIPCEFSAHPYKVGTLAAATRGGEVYVWTQNQ